MVLFLGLRQFIDSKRKSKNVFYRMLVGLKDFLFYTFYPVIIKKVCRFSLYFYNAFIFKNVKYNVVFVIAKYNENVDWLKYMPYKYVLYNKGTDADFVKQHEGDANYIRLTNVGREAHTYLTYIIDNYNSLPDFVGFLQGEPFVHSLTLAHRLYRFKGQGFYALGEKGGYTKDATEYREVYEKSILKHFGVDRPLGNFPYGAQFIVSRDKILKHDISEYKFLLRRLVETEHEKAVCTRFIDHKQPCTCLNEISAWALEVWWPIMFDEDKHVITY